ncbi:MAG TPA: DUF3137 domain-containing protein [Ferruginibacter sp.]|nr:DUF3137 domain-containing protein [Ferruginibacter sp.]
MEGIKNFDDFYEQRLQPYMANLREQGSNAYGWGIASGIFFVLIIPVMAWTVNGGAGGFGGILILLMLAATATCVYYYTKAKEDYEDNYKQQVILQIFQFIHPGLEYKPELCINHKDYVNSSLCRGWYDDYNGEDWIGGNYKGINFKCCELDVRHRSGSRNSGAIVYRGLFFAAPLPIGFSGGTYVWTKDNIQLAASIAEERYRMLPMPEVVRVDCRNGEFEKHYVVYTTDVNEASYLVNQQIMEAVVQFKTQIGRDISISFVAGIFYAAIPFDENLFEPKGNEPDDKEAIKKYFFTVLLILSIINKLQLDKL